MENTPAAPTEAPQAPASVETPTNNETANTTAPTVDLHGFSQDDLADMRRFLDNNGGWNAIKTKISTPKSAQPAQAPQATSEPAKEQPQVQPEEPPYKAPEGSITAQEFLAQQYFQGLSKDPKYATISEGIANGEYLKEMAAFGINALNKDGSINDQKVRMYLDLKAQTVPAKPTESEPNSSNAPTVDYITVGDKIDNIDQAYQIIMQPNHPRTKDAEEFIKNSFNKK